MSTPSKLADEIHMAVLSTDADQPYANVAIDQALAPVRECLEGLKQRELSSGPCWCRASNQLPNAFFADPTKWKHSDACLAAQQLYERLKIQ